MTLTFFAVSIFAVLTILSVRLIDYFETRPQLTVFFKDTASRQEIQDLEDKLKNTNEVSSIVYVSKEEALQIYREQNKKDPILLDLVTADVLPASIEVQATKAEKLDDLAGIVKSEPIVEEVVFQKDIVDTLISWTSAIRKVGITVISVLSLVSLFVILTIIGIKITLRREEIEIMRLIGASNWFIRMPFLIEGMIYGFVGAVFGWSICVAILLYATPTLESFLKGINIFPLSPLMLLEVLALEVFAACFLGMIASYFAVLRYLK